MLKFTLLAAATAAAIALVITAAATADAPGKTALVACDVDTKMESILWARQYPGVGFVAACKQSMH